MGALTEAGAEPERFFAEYAPHQFEIPVRAAEGLASADRSVVVREVVREVARGLGQRASFTPLLDPNEAGNGVHIHLNLLDAGGRSLFYDATRPACLSELGGHFAAGVLRHARALNALTAASPVSAARLQPHRWSAGAVCLAQRNREALLRNPAARVPRRRRTPRASCTWSTGALTPARTLTSPSPRCCAPGSRESARSSPRLRSSSATRRSWTRARQSATAWVLCPSRSRRRWRRSLTTTRPAAG